MRFYLLILAMTVRASASLLLYSESGTWGPDVTPNQFVKPNTSWSFSFLSETDPLLMNINKSGDNWNFDIPFTAFRYDLGGVPVIANPIAIRIEDFHNSEGPGMFIYYDRFPLNDPPGPPFSYDRIPITGFILVPDPLTNLYGLRQDGHPYLLTGEFPIGDSPHVWRSEFVSLTGGRTDASISNSILRVEAVPEPNSLALVCIGLGLVGIAAISGRRGDRASDGAE